MNEIKFERGKPAHIVACPGTDLEHRLQSRLGKYLELVLDTPPVVVESLDAVPASASAVLLCGKSVPSPFEMHPPTGHPESFTLMTGEAHGHPVVVCAGASDRGLKRAIQRLIVLSQQAPDGLLIRKLDLSESPWIPRREWTVCPWTPEDVRADFFNPYADRRMNIYRYCDRRLAGYAEMFDWFGYSGCQLIETCYGYAQFGSVEDEQSFQKRLAGYARDNGQDVTAWLWSAEFDFSLWHDPDVVYEPEEGRTAWEDPGVRRAFEKYYDIYANLAPSVDMFILHYADPGRLTQLSDIAHYARLFEKKAKDKNPEVRMAIDCWGRGSGYLGQLAELGFSDYLILFSESPGAYRKASREEMHAQASQLGVRLGIWGWYTTEYETDQLASMFVNARLLKNLYTGIRNGAFKEHPVEYWSEMEATHLVNVFSMYAAARLLWNPDQDPHEILRELTEGIWGPVNGAKVLKAVELIEDVRTGPCWETYWWRSPDHRVGTEDPASDAARAAECISELRHLTPDAGFVTKFPLPWPPEVFLELMLPHLEQIRLYAEFRLAIRELEKSASEGARKSSLEQMLEDAWKPIPEFNTWVGTFGSKELIEQKKTVHAMREKYGLDVKDPEWFRTAEAMKALEMFRRKQQSHASPMTYAPKDLSGWFWPEPDRQDRIDKLVDIGALARVEEGYQLADWKSWAKRGN